MAILPRENPDAQKVLNALQNPEYDWRTVDGIVQETGLSAEVVQQFLDTATDEVVQSTTPDARGHALYTTRDHFKSRKNILNRVLSVLSDRNK